MPAGGLHYDSNGAGGFNYLAGRLATRVYSVCQQPNIGGAVLRTDFTDMYAYKQAGMVDKKRLRVARSVTLWNGQPTVVQQDLDGTWSYDSEGRMTGVAYPVAAGPSGGSYMIGYNSMGQPNSMSDGTNGIVNSAKMGTYAYARSNAHHGPVRSRDPGCAGLRSSQGSGWSDSERGNHGQARAGLLQMLQMRLQTIAFVCALAASVNAQPSRTGMLRIHVVTESGIPLSNATVRMAGQGVDRTATFDKTTNIEIPYGIYALLCSHDRMASVFKAIRVDRPIIDVVLGMPLAHRGQLAQGVEFLDFVFTGTIRPAPPRGVFAYLKIVGILAENESTAIIDAAGNYTFTLRDEGLYRVFVIYGPSLVHEQSLNVVFGTPRKTTLNLRIEETK